MPRFTRRAVQWLIHAAARVTRPLTLGVRAVVFDARGWVLLVRHSYVPGWHLPGGGVEAGETVEQALGREAREEAGIVIEGRPRLHGVLFNRSVSARDHVVVFVVEAFRVAEARAPDWEILETGFFDPAALPEGTTRPTRARLREILDGVPAADLW
jgi:ADP-ribose pyrophosphatase YjhB (NUDIX family)